VTSGRQLPPPEESIKTPLKIWKNWDFFGKSPEGIHLGIGSSGILFFPIEVVHIKLFTLVYSFLCRLRTP
jgi:hypothetical protein